MAVYDIPVPSDFTLSGVELINFSWDIVARLLVDLDEAHYFGLDPLEISSEYWSSAKRNLTTALAIAQQGVEFVLKGKIAEISPYLLLMDPPAKWPSLHTEEDVYFSDFRTIDAQDLVQVFNTFSPTPLPDGFREQFEAARRKRNSIMHSVDKQLNVNVTEVLETILSMHKSLFPKELWPSTRLKFLDEAPTAALGSNEFAVNQVCWEIDLTIQLLKPAKVIEYFGISKKQRMYYCPICLNGANRDGDFEHRLAVLEPKSPTSTSVRCAVCGEVSTVTREDCSVAECKGNVISDEGICLTCGH